MLVDRIDTQIDMAGSESPPLLRVRDLHVKYPVTRGLLGRVRGWIDAVNGVSFDIARGTTLGLVGESGCGKSTLARAVVRLVDVACGRIEFDGTDVLGASGHELRNVRRGMQMIFQDVSGSLNPRMTIRDSIAEPIALGHGGNHHATLDDRVFALIDRVGLRRSTANRFPHELSGGQRQRVGVARAIALEPELVLCDEPVSALDVSIQAQVLNLLSDLKRDLGLTYLFVSHDLAVVRHMSDQVAVMYLGRIVEIADTNDLFADARHPYTQALLASARENASSPGNDIAKNGSIDSEPPDPMSPPTGCPFHPRCPMATDRCRKERPTLDGHNSLAIGHLVACHYAENGQ